MKLNRSSLVSVVTYGKMERVTQNTNDKPVKKGHAATKLLRICLRKTFIGDDFFISSSSSWLLFYAEGLLTMTVLRFRYLSLPF
jgi:hypothetical protein